MHSFILLLEVEIIESQHLHRNKRTKQHGNLQLRFHLFFLLLAGETTATDTGADDDPEHAGNLRASTSQHRRTQEQIRVWVEYGDGKCGDIGEVRDSLQDYSANTGNPSPPVVTPFEFPESRTVVVSVTQDELDLLQAGPNVVNVEPDGKRYPDMVTPGEGVDDYLYHESRLAEIIPDGVKMVQADQTWAEGHTGFWIKVCVIESGIDTSHEDFDFTRVSGLDSSSWPRGTDTMGHGTHLSGTIAAERRNGIGVIGVAPDARIHVIRVLDANN
jgi:hypothetical protein